nr:pep13 protein [Tellina virus 1]
ASGKPLYRNMALA